MQVWTSLLLSRRPEVEFNIIIITILSFAVFLYFAYIRDITAKTGLLRRFYSVPAGNPLFQ